MSRSPTLRPKVQLSCSHFRPQINLLSICYHCVPSRSFYPLLLHPPSPPTPTPTCRCCHPHVCVNPPLPAKSASLRHLERPPSSSFPAVSAHKWVRDYSCAKSLVWEGRLLWIKHYMLDALQGASSYIQKANNRDEREQGKGFIGEIMYTHLECLSGFWTTLSLGRTHLRLCVLSIAYCILDVLIVGLRLCHIIVEIVFVLTYFFLLSIANFYGKL